MSTFADSFTANELRSAIIRNPLVVNAETLVMEAIAQMIEIRNLGGVEESRSSCILVAERGKILGILTEYDLVRLSTKPRSLETLTMQEVMTSPVIALREADFQDLSSAIYLFQQQHIRHLPIVDDADRLVGIVTRESLWDLSAAQSCELDLKKSEQRFHSFPPAIPVGIYYTDELGNCNYVNELWCEIAGLTPESAAGFGWIDGIHPSDRDLVAKEWNASVQANRPFKLEYRFLNQASQTTWVYGQAVAERDESGAIIGYIGTITDISDRKQAEAALIDIEKRYRALFNHEIDAVFINSFTETGKPSTFIEVNDAACKSLGYSREELLTMNPSDIMPKDFICDRAVIETLRAQKYLSSEVLLQTKDGRIFPVGLSFVELEDNEGKTLVIASARDISDRKQAEGQLQTVNEQLRQSNDRLAQSVSTLERSNALLTVMQEASFDGILVIDQHRRVLTYNQKFIRQWHIPQEIVSEGDDRQLLAAALLQLTNPTEFLEQVEYLYANPHKISRDEISFRDGRTFDRHSAPIYWDNKHYGRIWFFRDISDRKQAEQENQQLRERLQFILSTSPAVIFTCRPDGDYGATFISDNIQYLMGYTPEEYLAKSSFWADHVHPDDAPHVFAQVPRLFEQGIYSYEYRFQHQDGHYLWIRSELRLIRNSQNIPVEIVGYYADISDRKQAELALQESQTFIQKIADASPNILYLYDLQEQRNVYANREISSVLGYEPEVVQAMGTSFFLNMMHPDDLQNVLPKYTDRMKAAQDGEIIDAEYRIRHANGEWRWLYSRDIVFSRDADGQVKQSIGTAEDISDRKRYEQQLEQTNAELLRATRLKDEFLATMSHELRTPLNAILGMTEALQEEVFGILNEPQIAALQLVERSSYHLLELINDILDLAKIEAGQVELSYGSTAIAQLCQSSMIFINQQAHKKQIQFEIQIAPNLPDISLDERRIRQVLINLLNNAVKFTPKGGQIRLEVDRREEQSSPNDRAWLRFSITDTGIGIAPENIQKLFQPFIQIDSALNRKYDGTGLGLALVKQIVDLHGGRVSLTSELGVGSCFVIDIPYINTVLTPSESATQINPNLETDKPEQTRSPLILIAEDNQTNIDTISDYLVAKGYRLLIARDGAEAIALTKAHHPDIILMDIQMPVMDGLEAIKQIRLDPSLVDIPIIALTALAMTGDRDRCLAAGANEYLSKPVKLKELAATIQKML